MNDKQVHYLPSVKIKIRTKKKIIFRILFLRNIAKQLTPSCNHDRDFKRPRSRLTPRFKTLKNMSVWHSGHTKPRI